MSWSPELSISELCPWPDSVNVVRDGGKMGRLYVPVTRCEDCVWWNLEPQHYNEHPKWCGRYGMVKRPNDYCSDGYQRR